MAEKIYQELCDMDFMDYTEDRESDIDFINQVINLYGVTDGREILKAYFEQ